MSKKTEQIKFMQAMFPNAKFVECNPTVSKMESVEVISKMEIPNNGTWYTERAFSNLKKENKRLKALLKKTLHCIEYKKNRSTGNDYDELSGFLKKIEEACNE